MGHPLDDEDIVVESMQGSSSEGFEVLVRHPTTGLSGEGRAFTMMDAKVNAKDNLLKHMEEAGGC